MYELWLIGIAAGAGAAFGLAAGGAFARFERAPLLAAIVALLAGALVGWLVFDWKAAIAGGVVGGLSGFGAGTFARGAVRRGGTPGGTAMLLVGAGLVAFVLGFIPIVGFLEGIAIPVLALRVRRRASEKYAGLRTLAK
jgi:hypothetical protein